MAITKLIADSGATKAEWCLLAGSRRKTIFTQGISPYFLNTEQIHDLLLKELCPFFKQNRVNEVYYYGTGMRNPKNVRMLKSCLKMVFESAAIEINDDMLSAARGLAGNKKVIACNLGTGSFCCYYNGKKIVKRSPGIGYILGDEGSGAYLGKKVIQYYLYNTFDNGLRDKFEEKYKTKPVEILENVYRKPLANRYLAAFSLFLSENRGHYMIENIIEDGLNDFFFNHLRKYKETSSLPVSFVGGVAYGFRDILQQLCITYEMQLGKVLKNPMQGLIDYHG
ncbi:MAG TPA: N-acetylglucosamine kinase [Chitinophagaceae bacterium]|jgi:N-acetylglucosamine kinase-like BadF-type ATPase|nr:N-acetylglucosamine kinase [Chitinophagaceae bacterium]